MVGRISRHSPPIFVASPTLEAILEFSETDLQREIGGFLIGDVYLDGRPYVEVQQFVPATQTRSHAASLVFTHDTWAAIHRRMEQDFPDLKIVGWHHTHPDMGIFLSGYDRFIHRHFFPAPWQVAMVVDPLRQEFAFFQWQNDSIVDCGFYCMQVDDDR